MDTISSRHRSDGIRTHDLCVPNAALYQTEPRFDLFTELFNPSTVAIIRDKKEKSIPKLKKLKFDVFRILSWMHHWFRLLFVDFLLNYIWNSEYLVKKYAKIW